MFPIEIFKKARQVTYIPILFITAAFGSPSLCFSLCVRLCCVFVFALLLLCFAVAVAFAFALLLLCFSFDFACALALPLRSCCF